MGPPAPPSGPEPAYMKTLAPKSGLCPPDFHYAREVWWVALPSHITQCTVSMLENQKQSVHPCRVMCVFRGCGLILYSAFQWSKTHEVGGDGWLGLVCGFLGVCFLALKALMTGSFTLHTLLCWSLYLGKADGSCSLKQQSMNALHFHTSVLHIEFIAFLYSACHLNVFPSSYRVIRFWSHTRARAHTHTHAHAHAHTHTLPVLQPWSSLLEVHERLKPCTHEQYSLLPRHARNVILMAW
eukprot:1154388-Pelagomonas_calceolata.AAC.3